MKRLRKRKEEDQRFEIVTFGDETFVYTEIAEREREKEREGERRRMLCSNARWGE